MRDRLAGLGTNVITISPGSGRSGGARTRAGSAASLKAEDAAAIEQEVEGVARLSPVVNGNAQVIAGGQSSRPRVQGIGRTFWRFRTTPGSWRAVQLAG